MRTDHLNISRLTIFVSLVVILSGCQSLPETSYDYVESTNFGQFKTFSWIPEQPLRFHTMDAHSSPLLEQRIKDSAKKAFTDAGLLFVSDPNQADLLMAFTIGSRARLLNDSYYSRAISTDLGYGITGDLSNGGYGGYWINSGRRLGSFMEGQVCVDLFEKKTGRPLWHGTAEETLARSDTDYWRERIPAILGYIAAGYPPINHQ